MSASISTSNSRTGVRIADLIVSAQDVPVRWSQLGVSSPAGVVIPSSEDEIIEALHFAASKRLQVIPAGGALSPFVPINEKSFFLDMRKFKDISIGTCSVTIGGGSTAGDVIQACAAEGCYTCGDSEFQCGWDGWLSPWGGSSPFSGIHGLAADHLISVRLITAEGQILTLSKSSTRAEGDLFSALRGAGHGLGVITSVTMSTIPISSLGMPDDFVWVRRATFPLTSVDNAATAFLKLQEAGDPKLLSTLMFLRAPPGTPNPGEPIIALTAQYSGPLVKAERYATEIFTSGLVQSSIAVTTSTISLHRMNDRTEFLNARGDASLAPFRRYPCGCKSTYNNILGKPDGYPKLRRNIFLPADDRTGFLQVLVWYMERDTTEPAKKFIQEMLRIGRGTDTNDGVVARTLPNNQLLGGEIKDVYTEEAVQEIRRVKALWDDNGLFWGLASAV
ncbi:hypothetical protein BDV12DRAFT_201926 [Aspergillus spectabilis]